MKNIYKKYNSFSNFKVLKDDKSFNLNKILNLLKIGIEDEKNQSKKIILEKIFADLSENKCDKKYFFKLTPNVIEEIKTINDNKIVNYLYHRYRYEIFPQEKIIDEFPPYLQIEPTSICNYRCVFCYQTDNDFNKKSNNFMGHMEFETFKNIVDQIEGKVEFVSLASRGEPLMCKDIEKMLLYTKDKFLNLKINTNASLLNEKKIHAILQSGVKTLSFSADAADEKNYAKLRVNGNLNKVFKNVEMFNNIRDKSYTSSKIITRVSGVKINEEQNIDEMQKFWGSLVNQVAFVNYVPWENVYVSKEIDITSPCSDLWRRMFIWWDGKVNPCDVDYKSILSVGNLQTDKISSIWRSENYNQLREKHLKKNRKDIDPCNKCNVV
jgi:radical SAM protein with 4Fe4S-binding SPASM domain